MKKTYFQPIVKTVSVSGRTAFANETVTNPSGAPSADYMKDPGMSNESFLDSEEDDDNNGLPSYGW